MPDLLLLSNSTSPGMGFLEHARRAISELIPRPGSRLLFVPFAVRDHDRYTQVMAAALEPLSIQVTGAHQVSDPAGAVADADAVFVGGGNSFRLLRALEDTGLKAVISGSVQAGLPYLGSSAGTNMACPTLRTTNDMPIVQPASFEALGLIPFQINAHYLDADPASTHQGETRAQRIAEFLECNDVPVLGLREGSWVSVRGATAHLGGRFAAVLFTRAEPGGTDLAPGTDLSELLTSGPRYDDPM